MEPISRTEIDAWPVTEAGLPLRATHACARAGLRTLGQLRSARTDRARHVRGMGPVSRAAVDRLFELCDSLEQGVTPGADLRAVLAQFLDGKRFDAVVACYRLSRVGDTGADPRETLARVGAGRGVTRERTRQLFGRARAQLRSRPCRACLTVPARHFRSLLLRRHGFMLRQDVADLELPAWLGSLNPAGAMLLVSDCTGGFTYQSNGHFVLLPPGAPALIARRTADLLRASQGPLPLARVLGALTDLNLTFPEPPRPLLRFILGRARGLGVTTDDRVLLVPRDLPGLLLDLMRERRPPVHYATLVRRLNGILVDGCRPGAGSVLQVLRKSRLFTQTGSGYYSPSESGVA